MEVKYADATLHLQRRAQEARTRIPRSSRPGTRGPAKVSDLRWHSDDIEAVRSTLRGLPVYETLTRATAIRDGLL
jgi:hypothetical protein